MAAVPKFILIWPNYNSSLNLFQSACDLPCTQVISIVRDRTLQNSVASQDAVFRLSQKQLAF